MAIWITIAIIFMLFFTVMIGNQTVALRRMNELQQTLSEIKEELIRKDPYK
ncbi:hypothetical protein D3C78_1229710 [compost metagenome]